MRKNNKTRREFLTSTSLALLTAKVSSDTLASAAEINAAAKVYPVGPLEPVPAIRQRPEWRRFIILVWQWQNDVRQDGRLYDLAGLHGFHIDWGATKDDLVRLSKQRRFPYYVDHAAGKGILHLTDDVRSSVIGKESLLVRPYSFADPRTIETLKSLLRVNVATTKKGLVYGYAFDDEISLGSFNNPAEVDIHPLSLAWYRRWLSHRYGTIQNLNNAWDASYAVFDEVEPVGFEELRKSTSDFSFSKWNLSRWMEWRHFMDYQFAQVLADLTRYTNKIDPLTPAGFVGGQQPSAYGGYDYAFLCRAVQWMEAYDDGGTNEILRSFWNRPRRIHAQSYGAFAGYRTNVWLLWHRLAHGNQLTIAWPEGWMLSNSSAGGHLPGNSGSRRRIYRQSELLSRSRPYRALLFSPQHSCRLGDGQRDPWSRLAQAFLRNGRREFIFGPPAGFVVQDFGRSGLSIRLHQLPRCDGATYRSIETLQGDYFAPGPLPLRTGSVGFE